MNTKLFEIWEAIKKLGEDDKLSFKAVLVDDNGKIVEKENILHDFYLYVEKNIFAQPDGYRTPFVRQFRVAKEGRVTGYGNLVRYIDAFNIGRNFRWIVSDIFERKQFVQKDDLKIYLENK